MPLIVLRVGVQDDALTAFVVCRVSCRKKVMVLLLTLNIFFCTL